MNQVNSKIILYLFLSVLLNSCNNKKPVAESQIILDSAVSDKNAYANPDQSPMDMSYFPAGYPLQKMSGKDSAGPLARVIYSRPHKKGRKIFGDSEESLCKYGKEWRLGANEATEIEFFTNANVAGSILPKGKYIMYCIPYPGYWTIIFNDNLYTWGLHMDKSKDVLKIDVATSTFSPSLEDFTMVFMPSESGTDFIMAWDTVKAVLPIRFYQ
jgi:hypothetical protein